MTRPIGYYVHHHGAGHRARAMLVADRADHRITLIGTGLADRTRQHRCIDLPDDRLAPAFDGDDAAAHRSTVLHYAPIDHDGVRRRVAAMTAWIAETRPALMVVDVSCEVAMLARLASVSSVYVRLGGRRDDAPHIEAFRSATAIISPFAEALDDPATPDWVREKTVYCPGLASRLGSQAVESGTILVVLGQGGAASDGDIWDRAARATPEWRWSVIGPCTAPTDAVCNLTLSGWVDDATQRIARADVVVGSAGDGVVGAVLAAGRPFVCLPEDRSFDEQRSKAARLVAAGAAILCDSAETADWAALIADARRLDAECAAALDDPNGADRLAGYLLTLADRNDRA